MNLFSASNITYKNSSWLLKCKDWGKMLNQWTSIFFSFNTKTLGHVIYPVESLSCPSPSLSSPYLQLSFQSELQNPCFWEASLDIHPQIKFGFVYTFFFCRWYFSLHHSSWFTISCLKVCAYSSSKESTRWSQTAWVQIPAPPSTNYMTLGYYFTSLCLRFFMSKMELKVVITFWVLQGFNEWIHLSILHIVLAHQNFIYICV